MIEDATKQAIIDCGKQLYAKNLIAACDGNISARLDENTIIITSSGVEKYKLQMKDFAKVSLNGEILEGNPSSEILMHLKIYQECAQATFCVHAHPPTAIAWTLAQPELSKLPDEGFAELILATGGVPIAPYARPGTPAMGEVLMPFLPNHKIVILARHGALSWGDSPSEAYRGMERLEHSAEILWKAQSLGGVSKLPEEEIAALKKIREKIGNRNL